MKARLYGARVFVRNFEAAVHFYTALRAYPAYRCLGSGRF